MEILVGRRIAFLGAGNMAEALGQGLIRAGVPASAITVSDICAERIDHFRTRFDIAGLADNRELVRTADVMVLAVKPQGLDKVLAEVVGALPAAALVVSICAGIRTGRIEGALGGSCRVVRVMPNTPALVGAGAAAICGGRFATATDLDVVAAILGAVGLVVRVEESHMDAVTALSGSGPAYVCTLIEAMLEGADRLGLDPDTARQLVCKTVAGTARMVLETGVAPETLRRRVTSKGGTTEAALNVLDRGNVKTHLVDAVVAAHHRSRELAGETGK